MTSPVQYEQSSRSRRRNMESYSPRPSAAILLTLCSTCDAFSSRPRNGCLTRWQSFPILSSVKLRTKSRLFAWPGSSDTRDNLFFAQDMLRQEETSEDVDAADNSAEDAYFYWAQSTPKAQSSGGIDEYEAQFAAMTSPMDTVVETENNAKYDYSQSQTSEEPIYTTNNSNTQTKQESTTQPISNVDARVLESILQEGKLDVTTEEEVKKLLEGPRAVDEDEVRGREEAGTGEYQSKFVSKISDNTFWNSLRAKADEVLESVQIYIENRIERDTQTLAAIGLFTLERVRRDISRALPAAGRQVKKLLLTSNSTYAEKLLDATNKTGFALPSERSMTDREMDSYEELTTPADEIKQVTEAIRDILSGKEVLGSSSAAGRRGVRSLAPAGTSRMAERQQRAYQARKRTVLQREKEGIDRTLGRAIGSVTDVTWELRQEMNSGVGREAGYRSKGVRKALAAGAVRLLEAGREGGRLLLSGRSDKKLISGQVYAGASAKRANVEFFDVYVDPIQEEVIIDEVIEETNLEYAPDGLLSPESFVEEKSRLITSLESCLSQPGQTWLTKEVVSQATESGVSLDGEMLREVITSMVTLRDELKEEIKEEDDGDRTYLKIDYVQKGLRRMKDMVDGVTSLAIVAAGEGAAYLLKIELEGFVLSDSLDEIIEIELERLEQLLADMVATREREIKSRSTAQNVYPSDPIEYSASVEVVEREPRQKRPTSLKKGFGDVVFTEVEMEPQTSYNQQYYMQDEDSYTDTGGDSYQFSGSTVEIVSDEEYSDYEQRFKTVQSSEWIDDGEEEERHGDNPVGKFVLRVIDAIFFVGEKFFLVGLPNLISTGSNISFRYSQAQNRGGGSVGWQPLKNLKRKKNQY